MEQFKRPPIVEGLYYSDDPEKLSTFVKTSLTSNNVKKLGRPLALITPLASYLYASNAYSASYSQVLNEDYDTVIIISPMHRMSFYNIALTESTHFETPLGDLEVDSDSNKFLIDFNEDSFVYGEKYHIAEHSIEVQLPYIITALGTEVKILPVIMGEPNTKFTILLARAIKQLIEKSGKKFLIVAASNLSNGTPYDKAVETDSNFIKILKECNPDHLSEQLALNQITAYGGGGIVTLLRLMNMMDLNQISVLKYFTSGDITNDKIKVDGFISACILDKE